MSGVVVGNLDVVARTRLLAGWLVVLLVAAACGTSDNGEMATPTDVTSPPAVTESATSEPRPPEPLPVAEPPATAEPPPPPEPLPVAEPPAPAEPPPADPPPPPEPPEVLVDSPAEPPAAPTEPAVPEDELDEAAVVTLADRIDAAQAGVASSLTEMYMTMEMSFPGEPGLEIRDVALATVTTVGDLVRAEMDIAAFMSAMMGAVGGGGPVPADFPPLEMIVDGDSQLYVRLGLLDQLVALDQTAANPWLAELKAEHGDDVGDMWVFVDLAESDRTTNEVLADLGLEAATAVQPFGEDIVGLLGSALADGALLEARGGNRTQVGGIDTEQYSFVIDLAALTEMPDLLGSVLGTDVGGGESSPSGFPGPLPVRFTIRVDDDYVVRRIVVDVDLGEILNAAFAEFGEPGGASEGAETGIPEIELLYSVRLETVSVNDSSLSVTLPDPSQVIELP